MFICSPTFRFSSIPSPYPRYPPHLSYLLISSVFQSLLSHIPHIFSSLPSTTYLGSRISLTLFVSQLNACSSWGATPFHKRRRYCPSGTETNEHRRATLQNLVYSLDTMNRSITASGRKPHVCNKSLVAVIVLFSPHTMDEISKLTVLSERGTCRS